MRDCCLCQDSYCVSLSLLSAQQPLAQQNHLGGSYSGLCPFPQTLVAAFSSLPLASTAAACFSILTASTSVTCLPQSRGPLQASSSALPPRPCHLEALQAESLQRPAAHCIRALRLGDPRHRPAAQRRSLSSSVLRPAQSRTPHSTLLDSTSTHPRLLATAGDLLATVCAGSAARRRDKSTPIELLFLRCLDGRPTGTADTQPSTLSTTPATNRSTTGQLHAYCYPLVLRSRTALFTLSTPDLILRHRRLVTAARPPSCR